MFTFEDLRRFAAADFARWKGKTVSTKQVLVVDAGETTTDELTLEETVDVVIVANRFFHQDFAEPNGGVLDVYYPARSVSLLDGVGAGWCVKWVNGPTYCRDGKVNYPDWEKEALQKLCVLSDFAEERGETWQAWAYRVASLNKSPRSMFFTDDLPDVRVLEGIGAAPGGVVVSCDLSLGIIQVGAYIGKGWCFWNISLDENWQWVNDLDAYSPLVDKRDGPDSRLLNCVEQACRKWYEEG